MKPSENTTPGAESNETATATPEAKPATEKKPAVKKPAAKKPAVKKPAPKKPAKPAAKKPAAKKPAVKKPAAKKPTTKKPVKKSADIRTADNSNRNFDRVRFNGEDLPKGRTVHAVVADYIKKHPKVTLSALQEKFPDELMRGPWGLLKELNTAKKISGPKKLRYFLREKDVLSVGGKKVAVCNQWSTEGFEGFKKHVKTLGYNLSAARK